MKNTYPGVYVSEAAFKSRVAAPINITSSIAAFFGTSDRGPSTPTLVQSWTDYVTYFGNLSTTHDLGYSVYHYFANGGTAAYVTRVLGASASVASNTVKYYPTANHAASAAQNLFTTSSVDPGTWGNSISITLSDGLVDPTATALPTFNLSVDYNGNTVETWTELSVDPTSSRYVDSIINTYSRYISVSNIATPTPNIGMGVSTSAVTLSGGLDSAPVEADWVSNGESVFDDLDLVEGVLMINAVGITNNTILEAALSKASDRGNAIVIIDPDPTHASAADFTETATYRTFKGYNYGVFCAPMLIMIDPARSGTGAIRKTFPGGAVAGLYARTEAERTAAKTPAGYGAEIRNALGVSIRFKESEIGTLYDLGINCFKQLPGAGGVILFGGRTLERLRPDRYVSVRRSLNYLKQALTDATRFAVFEPNDERLWSAVGGACGNVLSRFWSAGGLKGTTQQSAYYVVCDSSNNTATTIENGQVVVEVGVALQQPAEFIVIQISQWTGGSNAVETL